MSTVQPTDQFAVNRGGTDYRVSAADLKTYAVGGGSFVAFNALREAFAMPNYLGFLDFSSIRFKGYGGPALDGTNTGIVIPAGNYCLDLNFQHPVVQTSSGSGFELVDGSSVLYAFSTVVTTVASPVAARLYYSTAGGATLHIRSAGNTGQPPTWKYLLLAGQKV